LAKFEKMLACVDGSESSMKAADYAVMLAKQHGGEIIALNVMFRSLDTHIRQKHLAFLRQTQ
jgi:nucleotide-binding universal stress UspA family protein